MFGKYDITFCSDKDCPRTDCYRHYTHIPVGIPVSMFLNTPKDGEECSMYYGDGKNESSRNTPV